MFELEWVLFLLWLRVRFFKGDEKRIWDGLYYANKEQAKREGEA